MVSLMSGGDSRQRWFANVIIGVMIAPCSVHLEKVPYSNQLKPDSLFLFVLRVIESRGEAAPVDDDKTIGACLIRSRQTVTVVTGPRL